MRIENSGPIVSTAASARVGTPAAKDDPKKAVDAARQFESLLIAQMMKQMRASGSEGWLGTGDDQAGESAMELAEEQFAQSLSAQGGLGLAKLITEGLNAPAKQKHKSGGAPEL